MLLSAVERLVTQSRALADAARNEQSECLTQLVERNRTAVFDHLSQVGPSMWAQLDGATWRTLHLALLASTRAADRALSRGEPLMRHAERTAFIAQRYRTSLIRQIQQVANGQVSTLRVRTT